MTDPDNSVVPKEEQPTEDTHLLKTRTTKEGAHKFQLKFFKIPTYCKYCDKFIYGLYQQGYRCTDCKFSTHKRCHEKVVSPCQVSHSEDERKQTGHDFVIYNFKQPTFCHQCSGFIFGLCRQGYRCRNCKYSTHRRCVAIVGHKCTTE